MSNMLPRRHTTEPPSPRCCAFEICRASRASINSDGGTMLAHCIIVAPRAAARMSGRAPNQSSGDQMRRSNWSAGTDFPCISTPKDPDGHDACTYAATGNPPGAVARAGRGSTSCDACSSATIFLIALRILAALLNGPLQREL